MKENGFMRKLRKSNSCSHILKCSQQIKYQKLLIKNVFRSDVYWTLAYKYIDPMKKSLDHHCVKSVEIRGFFWSLFSRIRTEYGEIQSISLYSVRMRENTDQKMLRLWTHFTECTIFCLVCLGVSVL